MTEPLAQRIASVAGQVQEWAIEALWRAGRPATWPECPGHPNAHPLTATVQRGGLGVRWLPRGSLRLTPAPFELSPSEAVETCRSLSASMGYRGARVGWNNREHALAIMKQA